jgi:heterodisulfide reductase subunit B
MSSGFIERQGVSQVELGLYPGCSSGSTGKEYDLSVRAVFEALGVKLHELDD